MTPDWSLFAWQGVQLEAPRDWELGAVSGDAKKGYCRLDDADMPRLEVTWQRAKSSERIRDTVARYLTAAKLDTKENAENVRRDLRLVEMSGFETEFFVTHGETDAMHMAARCLSCGGTAIVRVLYRSSESLRPLMRRVFTSYCDHERNGVLPWAFHGMKFELPQDYRLSAHSFRSGRIAIDLDGRKGEAKAVRVSLAGTVLKRASLMEWLKADAAGKWPQWRVEYSPAHHGDHEAVTVSGRLRSPLRRMLRPGRVARGLAWHCVESNALFIANWSGRAAAREHFDKFAETFSCH